MAPRNRQNRTIQSLSLILILGTVALSRLLPASNAARQQNSMAAMEAFAASPILLPASKKQDLILLADPVMARRLNLTANQRQEIARIDSQLDREAREAMQAAIKAWQERGGFHTESIPNFRDPLSPYGRTLNVLKRAAEEKIAALLSDEVISRWSEQTGPQPNSTVDSLLPTTL